ncbi:hypothetical protein [Phycisphaera mikurensis]|uniref:Uncharacterized protein n=1 Tax=Phycisphaera mikurensis (strain NBRC 102666 / KCTC 22515 / FYK2301M01) TaxID=1142394 RepID=I0IIE1_PHYMF|nr:hypothetical protein [Phycisphaera mikurensis]MBB6442407.1 hypothetical protein [Phycisphaera mikurensis]BAM05029.1 hypothetical protein PSMK_28700 [Phycisphaera mikurensis NBRC 102666]
MKPAAPRFGIAAVHHRLTRGVLDAADRRLPAGFEPAVRGGFHLVDTLELRLLGAPAGEPPVRVHRVRVNAMTHAGDLLRGGWPLAITAGPTGRDVLARLLGPLGEAGEGHQEPPRLPRGDAGPSIYPLLADRVAAADPLAPWLLPLRGGRVRRLRFAAPAGGFAVAEAPGTDPFWAALPAAAGFGEAAAESRVTADAVPLRWSVDRPRPLLGVAFRPAARRRIAAVA